MLAALAAATGRAADEAERATLRARERERERFVSMVAHELRTPLAGLGGYLDLLAGGAVDDPEIGREFVERGRGIVERMASLVGDLLELSRIEAGSLGLEIEACSLAEICERAISPLAPLAAGRGIRLVTDLPPRIRTARVDRRRVEQIVANLVANACKFSPEGGLVELGARVDGPVALIIVRDEGPGIERGDLERVFRPFARLEGHERVPGTGLGLPISRDLARAMGGDVAVASVPASGSAFVVGLPAGRRDPARRGRGGDPGAAEAEEIGARRAGRPAGAPRRGRDRRSRRRPAGGTRRAGQRRPRGGCRAGGRRAAERRDAGGRRRLTRRRARVAGRAQVFHRRPAPCGRSWITRWITPLTAGSGGRTITVRIDSGPDDGGRRSRGARGDPGRQPDERRETVLPGPGGASRSPAGSGAVRTLGARTTRRRVPWATAHRSRPILPSAPRFPRRRSPGSTPAARRSAWGTCPTARATGSSGTCASSWPGRRRST